jgi:hypothetical protein
MHLVFRGADPALARRSSERSQRERSSTIALAKEALPALRQKLLGPK